MADRHHELAGGFVVVDAVDHATAAEGEAHAGVIPCAAGHCVAEFKRTVLLEHQPMRGSFGHVSVLDLSVQSG